MCTETEFRAKLAAAMDRRAFARTGAGVGVAAGLAACAPGGMAVGAAGAPALTERRVSIQTPDGTIDGLFIHPARGRHAAILTWPDIAGVRPAFATLARRVASAGHAVLVVNPYYRDVAGEPFSDFADFMAKGGFQKVGPWRAKLTADAIMRDATAVIAWLDGQGAVDTGRGIGTDGYCMGGPFTVWTAAAVPGRVRAAASLHGGGLVRADAPQSPHRMLGQSRAAHMFAFGQDDDAKEPMVKHQLAEAARAAGRPAEIEVYPADHGWTVPDNPSFEQAAAERAWGRMGALLAAL